MIVDYRLRRVVIAIVFTLSGRRSRNPTLKNPLNYLRFAKESVILYHKMSKIYNSKSKGARLQNVPVELNEYIRSPFSDYDVG